MKDAGFDISDYENIRPELLGLDENASKEERDEVFGRFVEAAHQRGIRIIFDIAMNHTSNEHAWFIDARSSKDSIYRDYYIWNDTDDKYSEARIIFKGMCESNWEYDEAAGQYFYHRFFEIQPDLNYRNPKVLSEMTRTLVGWKIRGVDGFRADAVPYIWKEEGTICENLPKTHTVVKFFRAVMDYLQPGTLMLAEACQPPQEVVAYFGDGDECNGAYHFPVMPRIYKALAAGDKNSIEKVMDASFTPHIPDGCQWFMFLRCHDELTLEMVTPEEREFIYKHYVKDPLWDFRQGEGISARLADLFDYDERKILLANSIMMTLLGTPIIYYGDEFAKGNDRAYYDEIHAMTGYTDSRYLCRGPVDWEEVEKNIEDSSHVSYKVFNGVRSMTGVRSELKAFSRGTLEFIDLKDMDGKEINEILAYRRSYQGEEMFVIQNLTDQPVRFEATGTVSLAEDILHHMSDDALTFEEGEGMIEPYGYHWLKVY